MRRIFRLFWESTHSNMIGISQYKLPLSLTPVLGSSSIPDISAKMLNYKASSSYAVLVTKSWVSFCATTVAHGSLKEFIFVLKTKRLTNALYKAGIRSTELRWRLLRHITSIVVFKQWLFCQQRERTGADDIQVPSSSLAVSKLTLICCYQSFLQSLSSK